MTRSDTDSWDLSASVGATATMVAAARAVASRRADPLVSDPFAEPLVKAAGIELFARLASGDLDFDDIGPSPESSSRPTWSGLASGRRSTDCLVPHQCGLEHVPTVTPLARIANTKTSQ